MLQINLFVNSSAELRPEPLGSNTEIALMMFGERIGGKYGKFRDEFPILKKYPFNSTRKRMSILTEVRNCKCLFTKGASEIILGKCTAWLNCKTMQTMQIDPSIRTNLEETITKMAEKGLRTIVLAYRKIAPNDDINSKLEGGVFKI
jgi:magnesium-transporting ATPase (P-type)